MRLGILTHEPEHALVVDCIDKASAFDYARTFSITQKRTLNESAIAFIRSALFWDEVNTNAMSIS